MPPLISILIPCYNHQQYITQTLDSILQDDYEAKEIVIINDGSKDNSDQVIREWIEQHSAKKLNIQYINRENRGRCNTLNELIATSSGTYLLPIASDDLLIPGTIRPRIELLLRHPHKSLVLSDCQVIDNGGKKIYESSISGFFKRDKSQYSNDEYLLREFIGNLSIAGPAMLTHRRIFDIIGQYPKDGEAEDWFFYQRAAAKKQILFWDEVVAKYRLHNGNHFNSLASQIPVIKSVLVSVAANIFWFPGVKNKVLATYKVVKLTYSLLRLNFEKFKGKNKPYL